MRHSIKQETQKSYMVSEMLPGELFTTNPYKNIVYMKLDMDTDDSEEKTCMVTTLDGNVQKMLYCTTAVRLAHEELKCVVK